MQIHAEARDGEEHRAEEGDDEPSECTLDVLSQDG
jgi:hypothetical protein